MQFFKNLFHKTHSTTLTVTSSSGFHLRPIAQFVSEAKSFECDIKASFQGKSVNAKAVNTLLSLNLDKTDTFTLIAKGKSAKQSVNALKKIFETLMDRDKEIVSIKKKKHHYKGNSLEGDIICEGTAIAPLYTYVQKEKFTQKSVGFPQALTLSVEELESLYNTHKTNENATIYLAQKELLLALSSKTETLESFNAVIENESKALKGGKLETKITDYQDLLKRVKSHLGYSYEVTFPKEPFILLAEDLLPSDILALEKTKVQGVILQKTSPSSHTAILLRSAGITSLILASDIHQYDDSVILDAQAAVLVTMPSATDYKKAQKRQEEKHQQTVKSNAKRFHPAHTKAKKRITVLANISDPNSARLAKEEGAEGVGLLRTEFLFDEVQPTLKEQQAAYETIFSLFSDVTVRTLDVGGDKALPYVKLPKENNPFLGIRGVRLFKTHPDLIEEQLYAIFLAAKNKTVKIMFPMICDITEFEEAKRFAQDVAKKHQLDISHIQFGIMIEIPSVLFLLQSFNVVVDFYSIGTNDLNQYLFATERTHPTLKIDALSPVIFTVIEHIVKNATKPVSICGELAANKEAIPQLLKLGIETLSVSAKSIAQTKEEIRNV